MKKLLTVVAVGALAIGISVAATAPSQAFFPPGGLFVAGVAGFMAGAVIASAAEHDHWDRGGESWDEHVAACEEEYGWHYDPDTNLVHRHGYVFQCRA